MEWEASVAGLLVGGLIGATGIGAGSLMAPLLILWLGVPPLQAVGSDLAFSAVTKAAGAWQHVRLRTADVRVATLLAAGSVPAALLAVAALARLGDASALIDRVVTHALGVMLLLGAAALLGRALLPARRAERRPSRLLLGGGALLGGMVGITSAGSGTLGTAVLAMATRLDGRRVVGTVLLHAAVLTLAAALAHLAIGSVRLGLTAALLVGSVPGVILGSRAAVWLPEPVLRGTLAVLLLGLGIRFQLPLGRTRGAEPAAAAAAHHDHDLHGETMTYIIAEPCIGTKDASCVEVCPVDCIYEGADQYYIHPDECIDCGACEPECPVTAIFPDTDVPPEWTSYIEKNRGYVPGGAP